MSKETLQIIAVVAGLFAALLTITERFLNLRDRMRRRREGQSNSREEGWSLSAVLLRSRPVTAYLFRREIVDIVAAGVLLNYVGLALSVRLKSILYLDMTGTALASFLLGPWWGATVGLLSNSFVNWLLYPEAGAYVIIFPWSIVNMTGGIFWGILARTARFRSYLEATETSSISHLWYLLTFGVLGACVMSISGTFVQSALAARTVLSLDPQVASAIDRLLAGWGETLKEPLEKILGVQWGTTLAWILPNWLQNWVRYIPDKTLSATIALIVMRYAFPLFERELIHNRMNSVHWGDNWTGPLVLAILYTPSLIMLMSTNSSQGDFFWLLWSAPGLLALGACLLLFLKGPSTNAVLQARAGREMAYDLDLKPVRQERIYVFYRRLSVAAIAASAVFVLGLPMLVVDFYRVAFNFFSVVYGFVLAMHLVRLGICQNIAIANKAGYVEVHASAANPATATLKNENIPEIARAP